AMATWIKGHQSTPAEDKKRFREYLEKALSIEADENVSQRLMILIYRQQAEYLLQRIEEYFL
ncbi:MAG: TRAP transporter TatT component family protein, partial [Spirochaetota bacterium]